MNPKAMTVNNWKYTNHNNTRILTNADVAHNINLLNNFIVDLGLIRLSNAQFSGQGGVAVVTPPSSNETRIVMPTDASSNELLYYAYKHPILDVYFKITFVGVHHSSAPASHLVVTVTVFTAINNGAILGSSYIHNNYSTDEYGVYYTYSMSKTGDLNVFGYCDDNGFWLAISPFVNVGSNCDRQYNMVANISQLSFMVQRDLESNRIMFVHGQPARHYSSGAACVGADTRGTDGTLGQVPCTWSMGVADKIVRRTDASIKPFTTLPSPHIANENGAVRVFAATTMYLDGTVSTWNFGTVNNGAMAEGAVGLIDLLGTGSPKQYVAIKGFGPVVEIVGFSPSFYKSDAHLQMLLPWVT